jgi:hypothetical protein
VVASHIVGAEGARDIMKITIDREILGKEFSQSEIYLRLKGGLIWQADK